MMHGRRRARRARGEAWAIAGFVALMVSGVVWPATSSADSASIGAVQDAGGGLITVTYTVTSTSGTPGQVLSPGGPVFGRNYSWYAYMAEDHASRPCNPAWANYLRNVVPFHEDAGSATNTVTFRPFFPRQIKLCVFLSNTAGERAVFEQVVAIPTGYGVQRSSGYNCSHFSRYSAQDYFWLYPGDPSELDDDNDGAACEWNDGKAPGPQIPAEPAPPPPVCSDGIDNDGDGDTDLLDSNCVSAFGTSEGPPPPRTQCNDGADNDGDGATDLADSGCAGVRDTVEGEPPIRTLTSAAAKRYVRKALAQEFDRAWQAGSFRRIQRCVRLARTRIKCRSVSWAVGDLGYDGWVRIWYERDEAGVSWNYAFTITRTNWYCVDRKRAADPAYKNKRCSKTHRVR